MLLILQTKLLNVLPAAGRRLLKCCACSEGARREMNEQRKGPAGARALVATHRTTRRKKMTFNVKLKFTQKIPQPSF